MQLNLLLESMAEAFSDKLPSLTVIYASSSEEYELAYRELKSLYGEKVKFCRDGQSFRQAVLMVLNALSEHRVFFLVDDIVFSEAVDLHELSQIDPFTEIYSLRLGRNLSSSYMAKKKMPLPDFEPKTDKLLSWHWGQGELDWGYPLSVDGHVFSRAEILVILKYFKFDTPTEIETVMQKFNFLFRRRQGVCHFKSRCFNIPLNRVQSLNENPHAGVDARKLLLRWQEGKKLDIKAISGFWNTSVHEEVPLNLVWRKVSRSSITIKRA